MKIFKGSVLDMNIRHVSGDVMQIIETQRTGLIRDKNLEVIRSR